MNSTSRRRTADVLVVALCLGGVVSSSNARAAETEGLHEIEALSIDELLAAETTVASSKSVQLRASPGVVTVITREEIEQLGARDLAEILVYVPGLDVAADVVGNVGPVVRGLWANEGKLLFLLDGVELNETIYGSLPLVGHVPLDDVERIEVLRGPGSARYGNAAELAVVNIVTRTLARQRETALEVQYGQMGAPLRTGAVAWTGNVVVDAVPDLTLFWNVHAGSREVSTRPYVDVYDTTVPLAGQAHNDQLWLHLDAKLPWVQAQLLVDNFDVWDRTGYDDAAAYAQTGAVPTRFPSANLELRAPMDAMATMTITPRLVLQRQLPWRNLAEEGVVLEPIRLIADRVRAGVTVDWQTLPTIALHAGIEYTADLFRYVAQGEQEPALDFVDVNPRTGNDQAFYGNAAGFASAQVDTPVFTLDVGARGELHSAAGPSFVPRVALTRVFDRGHAKVLVSGAFKAPTYMNYALQPDIRPERTRVVEGELGLQLIDALYLTVNGFDMDVENPIVYGTVDGVSTYRNYARTGARGAELQMIWTSSFSHTDLSWSYANSEGKNDVDSYVTPTATDRMLAAPAHRVVVRSSLILHPRVVVTPSLIFRSPRAAIVDLDVDGAPVFADLPASSLFDLAVLVRDALPGVDVNVGVHNALDEKFVLPQAYDGLRAPMPIFDREWFLRLRGTMPL